MELSPQAARGRSRLSFVLKWTGSWRRGSHERARDRVRRASATLLESGLLSGSPTWRVINVAFRLTVAALFLGLALLIRHPIALVLLGPLGLLYGYCGLVLALSSDVGAYLRHQRDASRRVDERLRRRGRRA
jgi:hypothetical protein